MCLDLTGYRARIVIGAAGDIVLAGAGVMPRHAELAPAVNGNSPGAVVLRALDGEVWVERGPALARITGDHRLADGDVIIIGYHRLRYRNVGSWPSGSSDAEGLIAWLK